jgi:hypothetical protein
MEDFPGLTPEDLEEFKKTEKEIINQANQERLAEQFGQTSHFFKLLGEELSDIGVSYRFDVSEEIIRFSVPQWLKQNTMTFESMADICQKGIHPVSLACALKAWLVDPEIFKFWGIDEHY